MTCNIGENLDSYYLSNTAFMQLPAHPKMKWCESFATPFPGTRFFGIIEKFGIMLSKKWSDFHPNKINFIPDSLLNEVPVNNQNELTGRQYDIFVRFIAQIGLPIPDQKEIENLLVLCNGTNTIRNILNMDCVPFTKKLNALQTRQLTIRIIVISAWLGILKSVDSNIEIIPTDKLWSDIFSSQEFSHLREWHNGFTCILKGMHVRISQINQLFKMTAAGCHENIRKPIAGVVRWSLLPESLVFPFYCFMLHYTQKELKNGKTLT